MDRKKIILLVAALFIAAITAFMARSMFSGASAPKATASMVKPVEIGPKVLVATRALPVGTIITADSFRYQPWPKELIEEAYFTEGSSAPAQTAPPAPGDKATPPAAPEIAMSSDELVGTVVRNAITAGQPITRGSLVKPGDRGFLAAALGPGMRAVTVPVSALTGVAGFVFPGDRVDLVLTQSVTGEGGSGSPLRASETILGNIRVLATDQSTESKVEDGKTVVSEFRTVTIEVTPKIAEKIAVAQTIGTISLSLRSLSDNQGDMDRAIASGAVNLPAGASKDEEERLIRTAMNRPQDRVGSYVTGADVSRFQRSTVPTKAPTPAPTAAPGAPAADKPAGPTVNISRGKTVETVVIQKK